MTESDLKKYCTGFFGYGNLESDIWLAGLEEGLNKSENPVECLSKRVVGYDGISATIDLHDAQRIVHGSLEQSPFFGQGAKNQRAWARMGRLVQYIQGEIDSFFDDSNILEYQLNKLGRLDSDHAMLELRPIPASAKDVWHYEEIGGIIPFMKSRSEYEKHITKLRIEQLQQLVATHRPRIVFCYGIGDAKVFAKSFGVTLKDFTTKKIENRKWHSMEHGGTLIVIAHHLSGPNPTPDSYFQEVADVMKSYFNRA